MHWFWGAPGFRMMLIPECSWAAARAAPRCCCCWCCCLSGGRCHHWRPRGTSSSFPSSCNQSHLNEETGGSLAIFFRQTWAQNWWHKVKMKIVLHIPIGTLIWSFGLCQWLTLISPDVTASFVFSWHYDHFKAGLIMVTRFHLSEVNC